MRLPVASALLIMLGATSTDGLNCLRAADPSGTSPSIPLNLEDEFKGTLSPGWSWVREDTKTWRTTSQGLEVRIQPGNMWGPANDAKNLLMRPLPADTNLTVSISVKIEHYPTEQYEQVDLTWYYDDSHMVKIGEELVDGKLCIVMGREERDKTRTIKIIPLDENRIEARLTVKKGLITGEFRKGDNPDWITAGTCDLPVNGSPKACLMTYQGTDKMEHWAKLTGFKLIVEKAK